MLGNIKFHHSYNMYNEVLKSVHTMNDLGVDIQKNLKFRDHCNKIIKKAYFSLYNLFKSFKQHSLEFYIMLYTTYIRPILESASQV